MVFPEGGKHLLEKNVAMLFVLLTFSENNQKFNTIQKVEKVGL